MIKGYSISILTTYVFNKLLYLDEQAGFHTPSMYSIVVMYSNDVFPILLQSVMYINT